MAKSDEYREMQISSGQLAAVILSLLALCVLIFYLGIRVGTKRATESSALKARAQSAETAPTAPPEITPFREEAKPAAETAAPAKTETVVPEVKPEEKKAETKPAAQTTPPPAAVTKPKPAAPAAAAKTSPTPSGTYYIQVGALDTRPGAEGFAQRIETLGYRAIVLNPLAGDKKVVYRVRVGPYETKEAAESARAKLAGALNKKTTDFFIVKG